MTAESWAPAGVDVEALKLEEFELTRRLTIVRGILRAIGASGGVHREGQQPIRDTARPRTATGGKKLNALIEILESAGGPIHHRDLYARMRERFPALKWRKPGETVRAMARRTDGLVILISTGTWGLSTRDQKEGKATSSRS